MNYHRQGQMTLFRFHVRVTAFYQLDHYPSLRTPVCSGIFLITIYALNRNVFFTKLFNLLVRSLTASSSATTNRIEVRKKKKHQPGKCRGQLDSTDVNNSNVSQKLNRKA